MVEINFITLEIFSAKKNFMIREKNERKNKMENKLCLSFAEVDTIETIKPSHINRTAFIFF